MTRNYGAGNDQGRRTGLPDIAWLLFHFNKLLDAGNEIQFLSRRRRRDARMSRHMNHQSLVEIKLSTAVLTLVLAKFAETFGELLRDAELRGAGRTSRRTNGRMITRGGRIERSLRRRRIEMHFHVSLERKVKKEGSVANPTKVFPFVVLVTVGRIHRQSRGVASTASTDAAFPRHGRRGRGDWRRLRRK